MIKSLLWWLIVCLTSLFAYLMYDFGWIIPFYTKDVTMLTYFITALFIGTTFSIGYKNYIQHTVAERHRVPRNYTTEWFISDVVLTLGMIGTIIGFILMLSETFNMIKIADVNSIRLLISSMSKGLYTALNTTLAGLISSVIIKTQLIICDEQ